MLNFPDYAAVQCRVGAKSLKNIHSVSLHCVPAYINCDVGDDHQMIEGVTMFDAAALLHSVKRPV